ncbi:MAG TPA: hypothetical protein VN802_12190 [Stellaceae bacterium]|nr:hypothetical protein [Stellaceae bacterium]
MTFTELWSRAASAVSRWREDQATLAALDQLDPRARHELEALVRLRRDEAEFGSKARSVRRPASSHIDCDGACAHSRGVTR